MMGTVAPNASPTTTIAAGSAPGAGSAGEAEFAASMNAVVTIKISDEADEAEDTQGTSTEEVATASDDDEIEIEIEVTTFEGGDLLNNLSVTSTRGNAAIGVTIDGAVGVSTEGSGSSENLQVQMGETLTFTVPIELDNVQGGTITFTNLLDDENGAESALVVAYDSEGNEVFRRLVAGDDSGNVSVDINITFSSIDFKPVDNGFWTLGGNSDFFIDRIDIATGDAFETSDVKPGHDNYAFDYLQFFELRNFTFNNAVYNTRFQSINQVFRSVETRDTTDRSEQAEVSKRAMKQRDEINHHRFVEVEKAEQRYDEP